MIRSFHSHFARGLAVAGNVGAVQEVATERAFTVDSTVVNTGIPLSDSLSSVAALGTFLSFHCSHPLHHLRPRLRRHLWRRLFLRGQLQIAIGS